MKITIYGAGAIGGYIAALLAQAGEEVSVIARGPHLAAIKANGLALEMNGERIVTHPFATDNPAGYRCAGFCYRLTKGAFSAQCR